MKPEISVVIPLYNCSGSLEELYSRLCNVFKKLSLPYEVIFINDGSSENDWEIVKKFGDQNPSVKGISFDNNYGQHNAIVCGVLNAIGKWIVIMDGDLQDNPEDISLLYDKTKEGYDLVYAIRTGRKKGILNKIGSFFYKKIMSYILGIKLNQAVANYCIVKKDFINEVQRFSDAYIKFLPSLMSFKNIPSSQINVKHSKRTIGKSSYNFFKRYRLGLEIVFAFARKRIIQFLRLSFYLFFVFFLVFCSLLYYKSFTHKVEIFIAFLIALNLSVMILSALGLNKSRNLKNIPRRSTYKISETFNIKNIIHKNEHIFRGR